MELFLAGFADWPAATSKLLELEHSHHFGSEAVEKFVNVLPSYRDAP